ncbi:unnamed protein product [Adineta ricciae]|uniref:Uncharacterized protein n=1 Tax=Adineta ricciae TaxID=249248 RepID=A0A814Z628_ADIRI|nr:unnamed protein product [Adineta ricciae]
MFEQLLLYHQRHEATHKLLLENQKWLKNASVKKKVYSAEGGIKAFDALLAVDDLTKNNSVVLILIDELFSEEQLTKPDLLAKKNELLAHPSYLFIKGMLFVYNRSLALCKK